MILAAPAFREPLFLTGGKRPLELFTRLRGPRETHVYLRHATFEEFARLFGTEVRSLSVRITRMPPSLLNPNYWEPLTRQNEQIVREQFGAAITRADGDRMLLWRADSVASGRLLRDGLDLPVQLLPGGVFRLTGDAVLAAGRAWAGGSAERFEWVGLSAPHPGNTARELSTLVRQDMSEFSFTLPEEQIGYSASGDAIRMIFADRALARRAVGAALRGFAAGAVPVWTPPINDRICDQVLRIADGVGWSSDPAVDVVDKVRTFEFTSHIGRTEWGVHLPPGHPPFLGTEKSLTYYDRSSGIWAVAT